MTTPMRPVTVTAADIAVGDRTDRTGKTRVAAVQTRNRAVLLRVQTRGARSAGVQRVAVDAAVTVWRPDTYVRSEHVNGVTGTTVQVLDLADPRSEFQIEDHDQWGEHPEKGDRWATVCVDHAVPVTHPTLALARHHAADPTGWCSECTNSG